MPVKLLWRQQQQQHKWKLGSVRQQKGKTSVITAITQLMPGCSGAQEIYLNMIDLHKGGKLMTVPTDEWPYVLKRWRIAKWINFIWVDAYASWAKGGKWGLHCSKLRSNNLFQVHELLWQHGIFHLQWLLLNADWKSVFVWYVDQLQCKSTLYYSRNP